MDHGRTNEREGTKDGGALVQYLASTPSSGRTRFDYDVFPRGHRSLWIYDLVSHHFKASIGILDDECYIAGVFTLHRGAASNSDQRLALRSYEGKTVALRRAAVHRQLSASIGDQVQPTHLDTIVIFCVICGVRSWLPAEFLGAA